MSWLHLFFYRCCKALIPFVMLVCFTGFAQQDTLKKLIQTNGTEKLTQLEYWFNEKLFKQEPSDRVKLLSDLEKIALEENDKITLASINFYRGLYVVAMDNHKDKRGIALMKKAIVTAEKNRQKLQVAYLRHSLGYYYFTQIKDPSEALQNMLQAHYIFEDIGYKNVYNQAAMLDRLGYVYYHLSNFNEALKYFKLSLNYPMENQRRHIGILNSVGQGYREKVEPDSAMKYFNLSLQKAMAAKDTEWIGINSGDIGRQYLSEKLYLKAKPYIQEYYKCSLAANNPELVVEALTELAEISLNSGNVDLALQQLEQAKSLLEQTFKSRNMPVQNYIRKQYLYNIFAKAWDTRGNSVRALDYLKEATKIRDSIERRARLSKNTSIQQMFEAEQHNNRIQFLKEEKETAELKQRLYISLGVLLTIIIALLYSRQIRERKLQKQKEALLNLEKEKAENELKSAQEQLEEYVGNLKRKAELIKKIESEMDLMRQQHPVIIDEEQAVLNKLSFATILTEDDWTRFRVLFEKVHPGFFVKLKTIYPDLTPAEIRLCSLFKLRIDSHQMAAMLGISVASIKKNRQRLRKKINLSKEEKIETLFIDF